jgi:hypothetical protein
MCRILKLDSDEAKAVPTDRGANKTPARVSVLALSSYRASQPALSKVEGVRAAENANERVQTKFFESDTR